MSERKLELERKKAKLQALRDEKRRKEEERKAKELDNSKREAVKPPTSSRKINTDDILEDLGIPLAGASKDRVKVETQKDEPKQEQNIVVQRPRKTLSDLSVSKINICDFPCKITTQYNKETQTPYKKMDSQLADYYAITYVDDDTEEEDEDRHHTLAAPPTNSLTTSISAERIAQAAADVSCSSLTSSGLKLTDETASMKEFSTDEIDNIMKSSSFLQFFEKCSRIVERSLEGDDFTVMYTKDESLDVNGTMVKDTIIKSNRVFYDEHWSKHRNVTSMDWSPTYPELIVASYNANPDSPREPDGIVLVWNMKFKKESPEFIFHCGSPVTCVCFARYNPNLIIGATYSGQIMFWDTRSALETGRRTPIQRTPLSSNAHTHPVYCIVLVGTQNAHNLLSVSTDGRLCSWNLDSLTEPVDSEDLQNSQFKAHTSLCLSFLANNINKFVVGSEDGSVYMHTRHGSEKSKSGNGNAATQIVAGGSSGTDIVGRHSGPITAIDCHCVEGPVDFSTYYLTASMDWTIKLWCTRDPHPLATFRQTDTSDYMFDVKWSPVHPALFASVNICGQLDIWNLNNDIEVPTATIKLDTGLALNKCCWHKNGLQLSLGDNTGHVYIYDIGESLALPRADEWSRLLTTFKDMRETRVEQDSKSLSY